MQSTVQTTFVYPVDIVLNGTLWGQEYTQYNWLISLNFSQKILLSNGV